MGLRARLKFLNSVGFSLTNALVSPGKVYWLSRTTQLSILLSTLLLAFTRQGWQCRLAGWARKRVTDKRGVHTLALLPIIVYLIHLPPNILICTWLSREHYKNNNNIDTKARSLKRQIKRVHRHSMKSINKCAQKIKFLCTQTVKVC